VKAVLQDQLLEPAAYRGKGKEGKDLEHGEHGEQGEQWEQGEEEVEEKEKLRERSPAQALSPMHVWALQAPPCTGLALAYALLTESPAQAAAELTPQVGHMVFLTCVTATILNILGMTTMKHLGASSMQIIGKLNTIILLAFSMGFYGERLPQASCRKCCWTW
jgi:small neutral amino acid transporter SnatA (MarC family)